MLIRAQLKTVKVQKSGILWNITVSNNLDIMEGLTEHAQNRTGINIRIMQGSEGDTEIHCVSKKNKTLNSCP